MKTFYYYKGEWKTHTAADKELLATIEAEDIVEADKKFKEQTGIEPKSDRLVSVTLAPLF